MYGKHFTSTYTGSMFGAGAVVFAVWGYVIAHTIKSEVELNPRAIGPALGVSPEDVEQAIQFLCQPDSRSRNQEHEGRRLVHQDAFTYFVPSHVKYRQIRSEDDRRAYNRDAQRKYREKIRAQKADVNAHVNHGQSLSSVSAQAEADTETEAKTVKARTTTARKKPRAEGTTFALGPFMDAFVEFFGGGEFPTDKWSAAFRGLVAKYGQDETLGRWKACLAAKKDFASPYVLRQYWPQYAPMMVTDENGQYNPQAIALLFPGRAR